MNLSVVMGRADAAPRGRNVTTPLTQLYGRTMSALPNSLCYLLLSLFDGRGHYKYNIITFSTYEITKALNITGKHR